MNRMEHPTRVLAIDPSSRGFGYIVLEGPRTVVDWGVRSSRGDSIEREQQLLSKISDLIHQYDPHVLILENVNAKGSRRCGRIKLLIAAVRNMAVWEGIVVKNLSRMSMQRVFAAFHAQTKFEIALTITEHLPELLPRLPQPRKPWESEDSRMAIFGAAAFGLAYLYGRRGVQDTTQEKLPAGNR